MAIRYVTGRIGTLEDKFMDDVAKRMEQDDSTLYIIVPKHLTLEIELKLIAKVAPNGSFRLQVLSFERLCHRVFECAGRPKHTLVDDRGRVMLMMRVLNALDKELKLYGGAKRRPGFAEKCVDQIEVFRQSTLSPDDLADRAAVAEDGIYARKLSDLSMIMSAYEEAMGDAFADGITQYNVLCERMANAAFISESEFYLYGFDMLPPIQHRVIAQLAKLTMGVNLYLPLENDGDARDFDSFRPMQNSYERLQKLILADGTSYTRVRLENPKSKAPGDLALVQRELFAYPAERYVPQAEHVLLGTMTNPDDEAIYAAAFIRKIVMEKGWRYGDVAVYARDITSYETPLAKAFSLYDVPIVLSESRPANRHPLIRCITSTLQWIENGFRTEDASLLLGCGMFPLTSDEVDEFANYCTKMGVTGARLRLGLSSAKEDVTAMEELRKKWMNPILRLQNSLNEAKSLPKQLTALFDFLTEIGAYERCREQQEKLIELGQRQAAAEDAQVWNHLLETMDQMVLLMGDEKLDLGTIAELIDQALGATVIKTLPQSGDSVVGLSLSRTAWNPTKLSIFMGLTDRTVSDIHVLMTEQELNRISSEAGTWMGLTGVDASRVNRYYLKNAVEQTSETAVFLFPISDAEDKAQRMGSDMTAIRKLFERPLHVGGLTCSKEEEEMRYAAPGAARKHIAERIGDDHLNEPLSGTASEALWALSGREDSEALRQLAASVTYGIASDRVPSDIARRIYGKLERMSVTRLETYSQCPFRHFVKYGLNPETTEEAEMTAAEEGNFYHDCFDLFVDDVKNEPDISEEERMERIDRFMDEAMDVIPEEHIGDSAVNKSQVEQLRFNARSMARVIAKHLSQSKFKPTLMEVKFGEHEPNIKLYADGQETVLDGRIDRVDEWKEPNIHYLRIIDYKRGKHELEVTQIYYAIQLQLIIYLAAAMKQIGGKSAGAYYFCLQDPIVNTLSTDPKVVEAERNKGTRLKGLFPNDQEVIRAMADEPEKVFNGVKYDGKLSASAIAVNEEQLDMLIDHTIKQATRMLLEIRSGNTEISPAKIGKEDSCTYCQYKAICQRDPKLPGGNPRVRMTMKQEELFERLASENET